MTTRKEDKRSIKSRNALKAAFKEMVLTQDMSRIVIKELAEKADVNRKTFYLHYADINDVLEDVENDLLDDIRSIIGKFDYKAIVFDPYPLLLAISDGVSGENDDFNKLLFSSTISNNLIDKIKNLFKQAFKDTFEQIMSDSAGTEIVLTFVVSGVVDAYRAWYLSDRVIGLKQVAHELAEVISKGLGDVIKEA